LGSHSSGYYPPLKKDRKYIHLSCRGKENQQHGGYIPHKGPYSVYRTTWPSWRNNTSRLCCTKCNSASRGKRV